MKNKKGFTLIELLAVIVILAIIALIATPIILNMITKARKNAARSSALGYIDAIEYNNGFASIGTEGYTEIKSGDVTEIDVKLKGQKPTSGTITVDNDGRVTKAENLCINGYLVNYDGQDATVGNKCDDSESSTPKVQPVSFDKDDWSVIAANTTSDKYHVGDEKTVNIDVDGDGTKEEYHLVIVNNTTPSECSTEEFSQSACGFVVQFKETLNITNEDDKKMNSSATNSGGWPASKMYTYLNNGENSVYSKLKAEIGNIIISTKTVSGYGSTGSKINYISNDNLYLLSTKEMGFDVNYDSVKDETRILDYYLEHTSSADKLKNKYGTSTATYWWLRSASSAYSTAFCNVTNIGSDAGSLSNYTFDVSPAFRIGK